MPRHNLAGHFLILQKVKQYHIPVLVGEVSILAASSRRAVDCTVGGGGHAAVLCQAGAEVLAIDRDEEAIQAARQWLGAGPKFLHGSFGDSWVLQQIGQFKPDFILLDLGVSSHQLDADGRGFSFRRSTALDMRMDRRSALTAAELLNSAAEGELADLFRRYGNERRSVGLARAIVRRRRTKPLRTSDDLVGAIRAVLGSRSGPADFARLFQAVRIAVNRELEELSAALPVLRGALEAEGTLTVISYHSGEDRIVKQMFSNWAKPCICPPRQPVCTCRGRSLGTRSPRKPITAAPDEVVRNRRSRSAKLRVFRKAHDAQG